MAGDLGGSVAAPGQLQGVPGFQQVFTGFVGVFGDRGQGAQRLAAGAMVADRAGLLDGLGQQGSGGLGGAESDVTPGRRGPPSGADAGSGICRVPGPFLENAQRVAIPARDHVRAGDLQAGLAGPRPGPSAAEALLRPFVGRFCDRGCSRSRPARAMPRLACPRPRAPRRAGPAGALRRGRPGGADPWRIACCGELDPRPDRGPGAGPPSRGGGLGRPRRRLHRACPRSEQPSGRCDPGFRRPERPSALPGQGRRRPAAGPAGPGPRRASVRSSVSEGRDRSSASACGPGLRPSHGPVRGASGSDGGDPRRVGPPGSGWQRPDRARRPTRRPARVRDRREAVPAVPAGWNAPGWSRTGGGASVRQSAGTGAWGADSRGYTSLQVSSARGSAPATVVSSFEPARAGRSGSESACRANRASHARWNLSRGSGCVKCASPSNPASRAMTPTAYRSVHGPRSLPTACSGAM